MNQSPNKNYFTMPNEILSLGLDASEIAVYAYLRCLENRRTYQCWPSYTTIGNAVGRAKNTVMRYVDALAEKGLVSTEPTSVLMRSGIKKNGNLRYTIRPIREAIEIFHAPTICGRTRNGTTANSTQAVRNGYAARRIGKGRTE